jgi:uncharacterized protein YkwD
LENYFIYQTHEKIFLHRGLHSAYGQVMKKISFRVLSLCLLLGGLFLQSVPVQAKSLDIPSPSDIIAAVNALRATKGLPAFQVSSALMATAQSQSDYQASLGTWSHTGADGSGPHDRIAGAGYYGYENVAVMNTSKDMSYLIYDLWSDSVHWNLMINSQYTYCGVGVTEKGGMIYITLDAGYVSGHPGSASSSNTVTSGTAQAVNTIKTVITSTPQADGKIVHVVEQGQAMYSIAIAYGVKVADIQQLNGYTSSNYTIKVGQKLLIKQGNTATVTPTITDTPMPPTRTLMPSNTATIQLYTSTPRPTQTLTPLPLLPKMPTLEGNQRQSLGIILTVVCGLGLLAGVVSRLLKKK